MNTKHFTHVLNLTNDKVVEWLEKYDVVLSDCDGVLWHENVAIPGSAEVINKLKSLGKRIYFVTNNNVKTRSEIFQRAKNLGYQIEESDIIAPINTLVKYLKSIDFQKKVYVIGSDAIRKELQDAGIKYIGPKVDIVDSKMLNYIERELKTMDPVENVGAVVIGWDEHFTFGKMIKASHYLDANPNVLFFALNTDPVQKYPKYYIPGTGAIVKAVETCAGRTPIDLGKPSPFICDHLVNNGHIVSARTLMIGDNCKIDVAFGKNCGFDTLFVGTGNDSREDVKKMLNHFDKNKLFIPDYYLPKLGDLLQYL